MKFSILKKSSIIVKKLNNNTKYLIFLLSTYAQKDFIKPSKSSLNKQNNAKNHRKKRILIPLARPPIWDNGRYYIAPFAHGYCGGLSELSENSG